jgi:NAD dependent epimerase/dehydratase
VKLKGLKILVTGADGFIGSHLTETLVRAGYDVRAFVMYNSFNSWGWLDQSDPEIKTCLEVVEGDIRDFQGVRSAVEGCDVVFHLAALISIPFSYRSPDIFIDTNVKGTLNMLQASRETGVRRMVHTSTSEVYGTATYVPIDEAHPLRGQSPYSASKIAADQMATAFFSSFDTPVATVRPFNTYGPRQSARAVIPTVISQLLSGQREIKLGSIHTTRDFVYVKDTVNGFMAVAESDQAVGDVVNIGTGFEISIEDTVRAIGHVMNIVVKIETDQQRVRPQASEVERLVAANSKVKQLTGWEPEYNGLEGFQKGLMETVNWMKKPGNFNAYKPDRYHI